MNNYPKQSTPSSTYIDKFNDIIIDHPRTNWSHFFTDGSKMAGKAGAAFVVSGQSALFPLLPYTSVFSAELFAILQALIYAYEQNLNKLIIFSDSYSALTAIKNTFTDNPLVKLIHQYYIKLQLPKTVKFCWIPSHVGIAGNTAADAAAKAATMCQSAPSPLTTITDLHTFFNHRILQDWQEDWSSPAHASNKLRPIKPRLGCWETASRPYRREEVLLTRMRIGHSRLTHGYLMANDLPPICSHCNAALSVAHVLLACPQYSGNRALLPLPYAMPHLLGNDERVISLVITFIKATPLFTTL